MISQSKNRVQAIKSKFENLNSDNTHKIERKNQTTNHLGKYTDTVTDSICYNKTKYIPCNDSTENHDKENVKTDQNNFAKISGNSGLCALQTNDGIAKPNSSYLYNQSDVKRSASDPKKSLTRQISDPGKKLHRSHAFRCDRSQKIKDSPKRHGSCNGRSETSEFMLKMGEKRLSKERLKRLGNLLEDQMRKENFALNNVENASSNLVDVVTNSHQSIPDKDVPKHILDQYAKVNKQKKNDTDKQDAMTDSGVSSETENLEDEKVNRVKQLKSRFEGTEENLVLSEEKSNLDSMDKLCSSSETMKLERKNPHLILTDTLKKALKQPLPPGPPPRKPPRTFTISPISETSEKKKDTKKMLDKLEQVLHKREAQSKVKIHNIYDVAETNLSSKKPKEMHYSCTDILDINNRTLTENVSQTNQDTNCFNPLNCAIGANSTTSLPYTNLNDSSDKNKWFCNEESTKKKIKMFSNDNDQEKCLKCEFNERNSNFKCHLDCKCKGKSKFYVEEPIYDVPCTEGDADVRFERVDRCNSYGVLNTTVLRRASRSFEDLRQEENVEDSKDYDVPCDISRSPSPEAADPVSGFERLRRNFENPSPPDAKQQMTRVKLKSSKSTENVSANFQMARTCLEDKFATDTRRYKKAERGRDSGPSRYTCSLARKDSGQLDVDKESYWVDFKGKLKRKCAALRASRSRTGGGPSDVPELTEIESKYLIILGEDFGAGLPGVQVDPFPQSDTNLNRLMNEIYDTVTAACNMDDQRPGAFPTDPDGACSEDSVKLSRSLTEKRKNYVRRVSSRVAYLDPKNLKSTRFRHQTSICSYKSEIVDSQQQYATFRSWKSFRTSRSHGNLASNAKMAEARDLTDSKFNLTDSRGNVMREEFSASTESVDDMSIDGKTGCVDIGLPFEPRERGLFNVCLLVGLNYMSGQAYVKSVFPSQVKVPPHIENLIFPETLSEAGRGEWAADAGGSHCYSLVLTDERGERSYGYCRRVLPEGASICLPLCYCVIGKYRAPGFYYKVLQEIESHHGSSETEINSILQQLFETDFPNPGEEITIKHANTHQDIIVETKQRNAMSLTDLESKTLPDYTKNKFTAPDGASFARLESHFVRNENRTGQSENRTGQSENGTGQSENGTGQSENRTSQSEKRTGQSENRTGHSDSSDYDRIPDYYDLENNNGLMKRVTLRFQGERIKVIKRPLEPRADEDNLSTVLDTLGTGLLVKVFGSLLLERKVVIMGDQLSAVSSCLEALQGALYPFVWQQPLISAVPREIQHDVLEAPLPLLAGVLRARTPPHAPAQQDAPDLPDFEEGMLIDLSQPARVLCYQGDEATILPAASYRSLKTSLQMETAKHRGHAGDRLTRNVLISEAFLRFFVDILGDFWRHFSYGEVGDGRLGRGGVVFDREAFIKSAPSKQNQFFLEWFTETAMFSHFIQNMAVLHHSHLSHAEPELVDTPLPNFYQLFEERTKGRTKTANNKSVDTKNNYKSAMNKRVKLLKNKLRDLIA